MRIEELWRTGMLRGIVLRRSLEDHILRIKNIGDSVEMATGREDEELECVEKVLLQESALIMKHRETRTRSPERHWEPQACSAP